MDAVGGQVVVREVTAGSPATRLLDQASNTYVQLEPGDVIVSINGFSVTTRESARDRIVASGSEIALEVRDGVSGSTLRLIGSLGGDANPYPPAAPAPNPAVPQDYPRKIGIFMNTYTDGVRVINITPGSIATRLRDLSSNTIVSLEVGDYILALDGRPIRHHNDVLPIISIPGESMRIDIRDGRTGEIRTLEATYGNKPNPRPFLQHLLPQPQIHAKGSGSPCSLTLVAFSF